jgi:Phage integrase, N-terminal SAM-like domain
MQNASGHVRLMERERGAVFYAALRLPDGSRRQRRLGKAWLKRSKPPAGYLTRAQAEARLEAILSGADTSVPIRGTGVAFGTAAEAWLAYVRDDRKRRPSTVQGYRRELDRNLIPGFGRETPLESITTEDIDLYRERLVAEGELSARSINKRLAQLHAIFKRAQRVYGLASNPVERAERQPQRVSGDITVLDAEGVEALGVNATEPQDRRSLPSPPSPGFGLESYALSGGATSTGSIAWSTSGAPTRGAQRARPSRARSVRCRSSIKRRRR